MKIYTSLFPPIKGEIGKQSEINKESCDKCEHLLNTNRYKKIEYVFDDWNGEDLIKGVSCLIVSQRLKERIISEEMKGFSFKEIIVSKGDYFKTKKGAYQVGLPKFYEIQIEGRAKGPEGWFIKLSECSYCKNTKWKVSPLGRKSMVKSHRSNEAIPRAVYKNTWNSDDIFKLEDPGDPIFTERFLNILIDLKVKNFDYKEAQWV
ncbi:MAG: hypothetical protein HRT69_14630 [Flavobacteriaceae bacterium]|nr:hypothetical protein [Flavobacteriaceae bacterium]